MADVPRIAFLANSVHPVTMNKIYLILVSVLVSLGLFTATSHAATALDPISGDGPGLAAAKAVYEAISGGHYAYAVALALVVAAALIRKYGGARFPIFHTDAGSFLLVIGGSFGTALAAALTGGGALTLHLALMAGVVAFSAAGGYSAVKALLLPQLAKILPQNVMAIISWLFVHASDPGSAGNTTAQNSV